MKSEPTQVRLDELTVADSPITYGVVKPGDPGDVLFVRGGDLSGGQIKPFQPEARADDTQNCARRSSAIKTAEKFYMWYPPLTFSSCPVM